MRSPVRHTIASACLWTVSGCATTDQLAPPVDERTVALGGDDGLDRETLVRGREVYLTKCTHCHSPEPIDLYPLAEWPSILDRMAVQTNLSVREQADLRAYVTTTRRATISASR